MVTWKLDRSTTPVIFYSFWILMSMNETKQGRQSCHVSPINMFVLISGIDIKNRFYSTGRCK